MKKKIISVFFAVTLCLFSLSASAPFVASAHSGGGGGIRPAEVPDRLEGLDNILFSSWDEADEYYKKLAYAVSRYYNIDDINLIPVTWLHQVVDDTLANGIAAGLKVIYPPSCGYALGLNVDTLKLVKFNLDDGSLFDVEDEIPTISSEAFSEIVDIQNQTISPKNKEMYKYSWRDISPTLRNYPNIINFARLVVDNNNCVGGGSIYSDGYYFQMYIRRNGMMYYYPYYFRIYADWTDAGISADGSHAHNLSFYCDAFYYEKLNGEPIDIIKDCLLSTKTFSETTVPERPEIYMNMGYTRGLYSSEGSLAEFRVFFNRAAAYSGQNNSGYDIQNDLIMKFNLGDIPNAKMSNLFTLYWRKFLCSSDVFKSVGFYTADGAGHIFNYSIAENGCFRVFLNSIEDHDTYGCDDNNSCDLGFFLSPEPFSQTFNFDVTRLPSNSTVTITGDTVYDYRITDNSTGDSSTINEYVTNNYTYVTNPSGSGSGSGNTGTGGDITVGGKVEVGGKVDVDINVNVNGNGGGGVVVNPGDYIGDTSGVDMDIADYIELVPKLSKNFIDFIKDFFSWLPAPIFGLIVLGFILLVARIALRR